MTVDEFNRLPAEQAEAELLRCCGAKRWVREMLARRPFSSLQSCCAVADDVWARMERADILEAFSHHPRIGDVDGLRKKFASTAKWASGEQSGVNSADEATLKELADRNQAYEQKFGHIFIVCATGKTAREMLEILKGRFGNDPKSELLLAAEEQRKIIRIRLEKLLT